MRRAIVSHSFHTRLSFRHRGGLLAACAAIALCVTCGSRALLAGEDELPTADPSGMEQRDADAAGNQVWLVSTRAAELHSADPELGLRYWRYEAGAWRSASRDDLLFSAAPNMPTAIYLHGNRINSPQSCCDGWRIYRSFARQAPGERPFRFVIWSWPSTKIDGEVRDVRVKSLRSDSQAYYLAWLVDQLPPDEQVGLIGYSYGARIVSGALHILGGGEVSGRGLPERVHPDRRPLGGVLLAGALDSDWLAPGQRHGQALTQVDRLLITSNASDPVVRWYPFLYGLGSDREALGYKGAAGLHRWGEASAAVRELDVSGCVGAEHDWTRYMLQPALVAEMLPYALGEASSAAE